MSVAARLLLLLLCLTLLRGEVRAAELKLYRDSFGVPSVEAKSLREAVYAAVPLEINANLQLKAQAFGPVTFLTPGEVEKIRARQNRGRPGEGYDRAWQYWLRHAGFQSDE